MFTQVILARIAWGTMPQDYMTVNKTINYSKRHTSSTKEPPSSS